MPLIPPQNIAAWIEGNFKFKKRKNGTEYTICNPFDGDTGFHFEISTVKGICNDWRGNAWAGFNNDGRLNKCTFIRFVCRYLKCTYAQALRAVAGRDAWKYANYKKVEEVEEKPVERIKLPDGAQPFNTAEPNLIQAMLLNWLMSERGIQPADVDLYGMHQVGMDIIWPYYEFEELVYWQSRSTMSKVFRFPPESVGVTKGEFLYGFDLVEPAGHLAITEAIIDAQSLKEQTVASGGAALTDRQLTKISAIGPKDGVILAPDNDSAGMLSVITNGKKLLAKGFKVYYSIPSRIEYVDKGETKFTKDWNEILAKTNVKPMDDMQANIQRFTDKAAIKLRQTVEEL